MPEGVMLIALAKIPAEKEVIEPGLPMSDFSTRIFKFYAPTGSEHKFHETVTKNWLPIGFNLRTSCLRTHCHTHYTCSNAIKDIVFKTNLVL